MLNERGVETARGGKWQSMTVVRLLDPPPTSQCDRSVITRGWGIPGGDMWICSVSGTPVPVWAHPLSYGHQVTGDDLRRFSRAAAERATGARKEADRLACEAWNKRDQP